MSNEIIQGNTVHLSIMLKNEGEPLTEELINELFSSVIFKIDGITKTYPEDITFSEGKLQVTLSSDETKNFEVGVVDSQIAIVFKDTNVTQTKKTQYRVCESIIYGDNAL